MLKILKIHKKFIKIIKMLIQGPNSPKFHLFQILLTLNSKCQEQWTFSMVYAIISNKFKG